MTYMDVLEKWAVYSKYDREQKKFQSYEYGLYISYNRKAS